LKLTERSENVVLRNSSEDDLPQILEIYNDAIVNLNSTFDLEPQTIEQRREWFGNHGDRYPLVTAVSDGKIVGYCSVSPFSQKPGYNPTVELSVYVHKLHRQRGIGKLLMADIISRSRALGYHAIISIIACGNDASIRLHEGFGFERVGHLRAVGFKFSKWQDVDYYELLL
jgi:L-amino acid N-acyltransferase YncA